MKIKSVYSQNILYYIAILSGFYFFVIACNPGNQEELPILGNSIIKKNPEGKSDTLYHQIANFKLIDQDSLEVTEKDFADKIYVADFFFTSCPTICPIMKSEMLRVYEAFKDHDEVQLISHTIDPVHDTIPLLKSYAERLGVEGPKWRFVTGTQEEIYDLGQGSYMVSAGEDKLSPGGFMHSGAFILVDKKKRIRGVYDGTKEEQVSRLIKDIDVLLKEYQ